MKRSNILIIVKKCSNIFDYSTKKYAEVFKRLK